MTDVHEKVKEESKRFEQALPGLLESLKGRWVVFLNGAVQGDYETADQAYSDGLKRFGLKGGFVVAEVKQVDPSPLTAGIIYGLDLSC